MKIKTITCHDVYNLGASLQAYALFTYLKSLGHEVQVINYKPNYLTKRYCLWGVINPAYNTPILGVVYNLLKLPSRIVSQFSTRKRKFDYFTKNYLSITKRKYETFEELRKYTPLADVYFAGSDQIWNTLFENGKDPSFYLQFAPKSAVKASYAASFATEEILPEWRNKVKKWIEELDFVSVRELSAQKLIQNMGLSQPNIVLDPVFLLPLDEWIKLEKKVAIKEEYLLVYDFDNNLKVKKIAEQMAKEKHLKIVSIFQNDYAHYICEQCGPNEFLYLVHHASFIISNSFHATAFSIIYKRPFIVFDRDEKINTRMRDLIKLLGLKQKNEYYDERINERLVQYCEFSKSYIDKVLKSAQIKKEKQLGEKNGTFSISNNTSV